MDDIRNLPPPIRPDRSDSDDEYNATGRGSLSDFSDYDSSDEETHNRNAVASSSRPTSGQYASGSKPYASMHSDEEVDAMDEMPRVIGRCSPETKVRMIEALHRRKRFAAMSECLSCSGAGACS